MHEPIPHLSDYHVSAINGFLPTEPPCDRLPNAYSQWEQIIQHLPQMIISGRLRSHVERMPILSTRMLGSISEWRRAYTILSMIAHAYIWGGSRPNDVSFTSDFSQLWNSDLPDEDGMENFLIALEAEEAEYRDQITQSVLTEHDIQTVPQPVSIPFVEICHHLELPTVATYAGLVLWNWRPFDDHEPIDNLENLMVLQTFTGSSDEQWFYLVSVAIEARGGSIIPLMLDAINAVRHNDSATVAAALRTFAECLDDLANILVRMYEHCDPTIFYNRIRPFFAGSLNMAEAGLPRGVIFDTGSTDDQYVHYAGGSNAQSSIIQFFDIVLGIEHRPAGVRSPNASDPNSSASESEGPASTLAPKPGFIQEMRRYMPGPHRRFLEHVERIANIRAFVEANSNDKALSAAYDACLAMLRAFRDKHINMVSRYIIIKAREAQRGRSITPPSAKVVNLASANRAAADDPRRKLRGSGGTALIPFLKQARDETGEPAINDWIQRIVNNGPGAAGASPAGGARLKKMGEHADGEVEIVGMAGVWRMDDSEGGICHW